MEPWKRKLVVGFEGTHRCNKCIWGSQKDSGSLRKCREAGCWLLVVSALLWAGSFPDEHWTVSGWVLTALSWSQMHFLNHSRKVFLFHLDLSERQWGFFISGHPRQGNKLQNIPHQIHPSLLLPPGGTGKTDPIIWRVLKATDCSYAIVIVLSLL